MFHHIVNVIYIVSTLSRVTNRSYLFALLRERVKHYANPWEICISGVESVSHIKPVLLMKFFEERTVFSNLLQWNHQAVMRVASVTRRFNATFFLELVSCPQSGMQSSWISYIEGWNLNKKFKCLRDFFRKAWGTDVCASGMCWNFGSRFRNSKLILDNIPNCVQKKECVQQNTG